METSELKRILYVSRITLDAGSRLTSTMEDILLESVRNNRRDGISGLLWSDGDAFAQVIEGPAPQVNELYRQLLADHRHAQVRTCLNLHIEARAFPRWSMCGMTLSEADEALLAPTDIAPDLFRVAPGAVLAMLSRLAALHGDQLDRSHRRLLKKLGEPIR